MKLIEYFQTHFPLCLYALTNYFLENDTHFQRLILQLEDLF